MYENHLAAPVKPFPWGYVVQTRPYTTAFILVPLLPLAVGGNIGSTHVLLGYVVCLHFLLGDWRGRLESSLLARRGYYCWRECESIGLRCVLGDLTRCADQRLWKR